MRKSTYFTKSELNIFNKFSPIFEELQMRIINRKTPESEIEIKSDKSGFTYKSVKAAYVKALVSLVTGANYNFEILSEDYIAASKEVKVRGRLTIFSNGHAYVREQFGQHYLQMKTSVGEGEKTTTYPADFGNGYKAAASDAFKKCASEFGFCWDIYGQEHADKKKEEVPELSYQDQKKLERLAGFLKEATTADNVEYIYSKWLETGEETEASKDLLKVHMNRVLNIKPE